LPLRENDILYLRFPVPLSGLIQNKTVGNKIIFIGRLSEEKGYTLLPEIDTLLQQKNIRLNWHIVGENNTQPGFEIAWNESGRVKYYGQQRNEDVFAILQGMDYFILPSLQEGMPVALIEAMNSGVIPLVNDIHGGVQELVSNQLTGYKIKQNTPAEYADKIVYLREHQEIASQIRENCHSLTLRLFEPYHNTRLIEDELIRVSHAPRMDKKAKRVYGSRLDQTWMPNLFTRSIRKLI
jgi:glycosyltransferase involved in cell wall biosynthesis